MNMKVPVCDICRLTPIRCVLCEKKFKQGELTKGDFDVSRIISESKSDVELEKAFDLGSCYVAVYKGEFSEDYEEISNKRIIKIVSSKDLLSKLKIVTRPSKIFKNGEEIERMVINKVQIRNLGLKGDALVKAMAYFNSDVSIV